MQWLNINTEFLHAPEFLASDPVSRATWLCVLGYCVMQENDGCIFDGEAWGDRMWQQACGVTLQEVKDTYLLIDIREGHVYVFAYPHDKQAEVQAKRIGGKGDNQSLVRVKPAKSCHQRIERHNGDGRRHHHHH